LHLEIQLYPCAVCNSVEDDESARAVQEKNNLSDIDLNVIGVKPYFVIMNGRPG